MSLKYSLIIPVYNRPEEVKELLETIAAQTFAGDFETIVIEDGSTLSSREVVAEYTSRIAITYLEKENSGPGDSRNYGMERASGDYFIILDSDCLLPDHYLESVDEFLGRHYVDCFGGADAATEHFTPIQKAINYAMTSLLTTGGIRGSLVASIWGSLAGLSRLQEALVVYTLGKTPILPYACGRKVLKQPL